jgi:hypothetical protein
VRYRVTATRGKSGKTSGPCVVHLDPWQCNGRPAAYKDTDHNLPGNARVTGKTKDGKTEFEVESVVKVQDGPRGSDGRFRYKEEKQWKRMEPVRQDPWNF